jgi:hypothetical protein
MVRWMRETYHQKLPGTGLIIRFSQLSGIMGAALLLAAIFAQDAAMGIYPAPTPTPYLDRSILL